MSKREAPLETLAKFLPAAAVEPVITLLRHYRVHLTVTRKRYSVLGDYRHASGAQAHRISVNGDLNPYSFLITLIHELAHLVSFNRFGNRIEPHGLEWKTCYAQLLRDFIRPEIFPPELCTLLERSLGNLPATSCSDEPLMRALACYDRRAQGVVWVEELPLEALFDAGKGRIFRRGPKLRKRYQCEELETGRIYLFHGLYEVRACEGVRPAGPSGRTAGHRKEW